MAAKKSPAKKSAAKKKAPVKKTPAAKKRAPVKQAAPAKKTPATKKPGPAPKPPRAPGERRYWLVKSEPEVFSWDDLWQAPGRTTCWDGVRNYQARNSLRDEMKLGDGVLLYHSNAEPPAIVGLCEVAREGYPDDTQFDPKHDHFDPDADPSEPTWYMVDVRAVQPLARPLALPELREIPGLSTMVLLQKGSRLSVQPVSAAEWALVAKLGGAG